MQYATPQFIESEGKIISFLTFKQFFILTGGGLVCGLLFLILPFSLFVLGSIFVMGVAAIIAFFKINGFSATTIFLQFLGFTMGTKSYLWKKKEAAYPFKVQQKPEPTAPEQIAPMPKMQESKLQSIRTMIETKR